MSSSDTSEPNPYLAAETDGQPRYRIISFDGGPTILNSLYCLKYLEQEFLDRNLSIVTKADMFAGTSAGSVTALYFASRDWDAMIEKYGPAAGLVAINGCIKMVEDIFINLAKHGQRLTAYLGLRALFGSEPVSEVLRRRENLGELMMSDVTKRDFVVPTYNLSQEEDCPLPMPLVYSRLNDYNDANASARDQMVGLLTPPSDSDLPLYEICLRSSAFPVIFPIRSGEIDGGVYANNPAMLAIMYSSRGWYRLGFPRHARAQRLDNLDRLRVLSLGSRVVQFGSEDLQQALSTNESLDWGTIQWLLQVSRPLALADVITSSNTVLASVQSYYLLGQRGFARIAANTDQGIIDLYIELFRNRTRQIMETARSIATQWFAGYDRFQSDGLTAREARDWVMSAWLPDGNNQ